MNDCVVGEQEAIAEAEDKPERLQVRDNFDKKFGEIVKRGKGRIWQAQNFYVESLHNPGIFQAANEETAVQERILTNVRSLFPEEGTHPFRMMRQEQRLQALNTNNGDSFDID